ncbi:UNVERIFIED_CONTAM: hypothetical protein K2H54_021206 [Gekko kuhli]
MLHFTVFLDYLGKTVNQAYRQEGPEGNCRRSACANHNLLKSSQPLLPDAPGSPKNVVPTPAESQVVPAGSVGTSLDAPTAACFLRRSNSSAPPAAPLYSDNYGRLKFGVQYVENLRELWVLIDSCQGLRVGSGKGRRPSPYVMAFLLPWDGRIRKTKVQKATRDPVFHEQFRFPVGKVLRKDQSLNISVWHQEPFACNCFLGHVNIELAKWNLNAGDMLWHPLQPRRRPSRPV